MSTSPTSREAPYARIRATSRTQVTLDEMQRPGFWLAEGSMVPVDAELIRRETELNQALHALGSELREIEDPVLALRRLRKERRSAITAVWPCRRKPVAIASSLRRCCA